MIEYVMMTSMKNYNCVEEYVPSVDGLDDDMMRDIYIPFVDGSRR